MTALSECPTCWSIILRFKLLCYKNKVPSMWLVVFFHVTCPMNGLLLFVVFNVLDSNWPLSIAVIGTFSVQHWINMKAAVYPLQNSFLFRSYFVNPSLLVTRILLICLTSRLYFHLKQFPLICGKWISTSVSNTASEVSTSDNFKWFFKILV